MLSSGSARRLSPATNGILQGGQGASAAQGVFQKRCNDWIALVEQYGKSRGSQQKRVFSKSRRGIDGGQRTALSFDFSCAHEELSVKVMGFDSRSHARKVSAQGHAISNKRKPVGVKSQCEACWLCVRERGRKPGGKMLCRGKVFRACRKDDQAVRKRGRIFRRRAGRQGRAHGPIAFVHIA